MSNRYYIVKLKSTKYPDKWVYGFKDSYSSNNLEGSDLFMVDDDILIIECPADAISVCSLINNKL